MTENNLYFGRSKYAVLPKSRNDRVNENQLAFSKLQKFCLGNGLELLSALKVFAVKILSTADNASTFISIVLNQSIKSCQNLFHILLKGVQWIHFLFCKIYIETKVEGRFYEEIYSSLNTYVTP